MRIIDLTDARKVELWPGRRLYFREGDAERLIALPRGAAVLTAGAKRSSIAFGPTSKTTVSVTAPPRMALNIMTAIINTESPPPEKRHCC